MDIVEDLNLRKFTKNTSVYNYLKLQNKNVNYPYDAMKTEQPYTQNTHKITEIMPPNIFLLPQVSILNHVFKRHHQKRIICI